MIGKDISFFNATSIGKNCVVELGDACFGALFVPVPLNVTGDDDPKCIELKRLGASYCARNDDDYWGGAVLACGGTDFMPIYADFNKFTQNAYKGGKYISGKAEEYGLPTPPSNNAVVYFWLSHETGPSGAGVFYYNKGGFYSGSMQRTSYSSNVLAICKIIE